MERSLVESQPSGPKSKPLVVVWVLDFLCEDLFCSIKDPKKAQNNNLV